ncbi:MAG: endonuclease III [Candidatus Latescibacteria bacterium]|nr:endonuclease III [Candidatus Latescibacterota bacterium]
MEIDIDNVIKILRESVKNFQEPIVTEITKKSRDPYKVLISTIISLRTKDDVTRKASQKLYELADTPDEMLKLNSEQIADAIFPAGFYRNKAETIINISKILIEKYNGMVPDEIDELLTIKGIGRKTANLVVTMGYGKEGICVDTHVHKVSNRLGYVSTKNPIETEFALRGKLPKKYWIEYNDLLVTFGQNICVPISPFCTQCPIHNYCKRVGVKQYR